MHLKDEKQWNKWTGGENKRREIIKNGKVQKGKGEKNKIKWKGNNKKWKSE